MGGQRGEPNQSKDLYPINYTIFSFRSPSPALVTPVTECMFIQP
jgi:hypothetical protein